MKGFRTFLGFNLSQKFTLMKVFCCLILIKIGLLILPFNKFKSVYNFFAQKNKIITNTEKEAFITKIIKGLAYYVPFGFTCLPQALSLKYYLSADNTASLIIGVNNTSGFKAHAWVERNKEFLIGDLPLETYMPIWEWS